MDSVLTKEIRNMRRIICLIGAVCASMISVAQIQTNAGVEYLQCMQKDMSTDFCDLAIVW